MKIIFMGTPGFAVPSLEKIFNSRHKLSAIVTAPDKEKGRGQKVKFSPVKEFAINNKIPLFQPEKLKEDNFLDSMRELAPDLFVVVAFRILPRELFEIPKYGSFNLHGSLLPKYRGAAPIQWAIINGERETGVTTFALENKVDTGNCFLQKKIEISDKDNFGTIHDKLSLTGADAVMETIGMIESGNYNLIKQDDLLATPAPKITKETGRIDWNRPAIEINNLIRGLSPYPGAYFFHDGKLIKIFSASAETTRELKPGEIFATKEDIIIGCGINSLRLIELQLEGRKKLPVVEFLRGFKF